MPDANRLLDLIEEGIVGHGGDLGGWTRRSDESLQVFDGRVTLRAELKDQEEARQDVVPRLCHVARARRRGARCVFVWDGRSPRKRPLEPQGRLAARSIAAYPPTRRRGNVRFDTLLALADALVFHVSQHLVNAHFFNNSATNSNTALLTGSSGTPRLALSLV